MGAAGAIAVLTLRGVSPDGQPAGAEDSLPLPDAAPADGSARGDSVHDSAHDSAHDSVHDDDGDRHA